MATTAQPTNLAPITFAAMSAQRVLVFGGIALIAGGMLFGDIFAVFVLHQNGGQTGEALLSASRAAAVGNSLAVKDSFQHIGGLLEDHGTKVDAHVHMIGAGYLALMLALLQPYVALRQAKKRLLAWWFVVSGLLLPIGIFLIHYVGLAYSPSSVIGWASVLADSAGAILIVVLAVEAWAFWRHFHSGGANREPALPRDRSWESRILLSGGTLLVLLGFLYGACYAAIDLYEHEARETRILNSMLESASTRQGGETAAVADYSSLAAEKALKIGAHAHIIEFGLLAILLSFIQPYVQLREIWKRRWVHRAVVWFGDLARLCPTRVEDRTARRRNRRCRRLDGDCRARRHAGGRLTLQREPGCRCRWPGMNTARKILIFGGLTLVSFGMLYGLYYALFVEHQTLDRMGSSLTAAFVHAAEGNLPAAESSVEAYASTKYDYVRQVDVHSHWIGLGTVADVNGRDLRPGGFQPSRETSGSRWHYSRVRSFFH